MFNSIIVPYRNRPQHLLLFLAAMQEAAKYITKDVELLIANYSDPEVLDGYNIFPDNFEVRWLTHQFQPPLFHKAKALNLAVKEAIGDYITIMDVDCLMPPPFLRTIEDFYVGNSSLKLGHRVRLMNPIYSARFSQRGIGYMEEAMKKASLFNYATEGHKEITTGCGIFTLRKDQFDRIGGYDERFCGWGLEDCDFNLRAHKNGIETTLNTGCDLFHLHHDRTSDWKDEKAYEANFELFEQNQRDGHPNPPNPPEEKPTPKRVGRPKGKQKGCGCSRN